MSPSLPTCMSTWQRVLLTGGYWALISIVLGFTVHDPFIEDAVGYMGTATESFSKHPWKPYVDIGDTGHPQLFCYLVAWFWRFNWAARLEFSHLAVWLSGALALSASHGMAVRIMAGRLGRSAHLAGVATALVLLTHPLMISHLAQYLNDVPMMACGMALMLAIVEQRYGWATLWACGLAFTKMTGPVGVVAIGMFEFALWLGARGWRLPWKQNALRLMPFVVSGTLFSLYLFVKLVLLDRPLTIFQEHTVWNTNFKDLLEESLTVARVFLWAPSFAMAFWLWIAVGGLFVTIIRWGRRRASKASPQQPFAPPAQWHAYGIMLWMTLVYCLFYAFQALWDQARWFLMFYPLVAIGGIHGLLILTGNRRAVWIPLAGLWMAFQVARWHGAWIEPIDSILPGTAERLKVKPPSFSLDYRTQLKLYQQAVAAIEHGKPTQRVFCLYPTSGVISLPCNGYVEREIPIRCVDWFPSQQELAQHVDQDLSANTGEVLTLFCSWDFMVDESRGRLRDLYATEVIDRMEGPAGEWIELSRVLRPQAAQE